MFFKRHLKDILFQINKALSEQLLSGNITACQIRTEAKQMRVVNTANVSELLV